MVFPKQTATTSFGIDVSNFTFSDGAQFQLFLGKDQRWSGLSVPGEFFSVHVPSMHPKYLDVQPFNKRSIVIFEVQACGVEHRESFSREATLREFIKRTLAFYHSKPNPEQCAMVDPPFWDRRAKRPYNFELYGDMLDAYSIVKGLIKVEEGVYKLLFQSI